MPVYTYTNLDDPLVPGGAFAHGINNAGQIVGGYIGASRNGGFLYSGGTFTALDDPLGADGTTAFGINNAGQIVGDYFDASNNGHSFFYVGGTFTILNDPLGTLGEIRDISRGSGGSCRSWRYWAGPLAATCGSIRAGPEPMP